MQALPQLMQNRYGVSTTMKDDAVEEPIDTSDRVAVMMQGFKEEYSTVSEDTPYSLDEARVESGQSAQDKYREGDYETALSHFAKQYMVQRIGGIEDELEASLNSNIGACLHHLGEEELAKARAHPLVRACCGSLPARCRS